MSGGAYNYLCHADVETLVVDHSFDEQLDEMLQRLQALPYTAEAAADTLALVTALKEQRRQLEELCSGGLGFSLPALQQVWKAIEWWDSGDWHEGEVRAALLQYQESRCPGNKGVPQQRDHLTESDD